MSDTPNGEGWWLASDGRWYPPEAQPGPTAAPTWQPEPPRPRYYVSPAYRVVRPKPVVVRSGIPVWTRIVAVLVLGLIGISVAVYFGAKKPPMSAIEAARLHHEPRQGLDRTDPIAMATPANIGGGWVLTIDSVAPADEPMIAWTGIPNPPPRPDRRYIVVTATAEYHGAVRVGVFGRPMSILGSDATPRSQAGEAVVTPGISFKDTAQVLQGRTVAGELVFIVGIDETDLVLKVENGGSQDVWFVLE